MSIYTYPPDDDVATTQKWRCCFQGDDAKSWVLRSDGSTFNKGSEIAICSEGFAPEEGDTIGCAYDHDSLDFFLNGERLADISITGIRGQVFPAFYIDSGAILDTKFAAPEFAYPPPAGYGEILVEQNLL